MDEWLFEYAALACETFPKANPAYPGTGAAGGLGFAFLTFTNAVLESGIKIVLEETRLGDYIKDADIVITGEGRLDGQTAMGKAPIGVAKLAKEFGKPVLAFSGAVTKDAAACNARLRKLEILEIFSANSLVADAGKAPRMPLAGAKMWAPGWS